MDIGNSLEELRIKHNGKIYLLFGNGWVDVLDANGNLNVKIKNTINSGIPTSDSPDGFYYDGTNIYMKLGSDTINMTESSLPEGSIIMYKGDEAPDGWYKYADSDEFNGVIYIINKSGNTPTIANVILRWNPSTNPIRTTLGESFTSPVLEKIVGGNIPLIIDYSSSDTSKAIIDGNGNVTLKAAGQTTIKAETAANSLHKAASTSYVLIISERDTSITVNPLQITIPSDIYSGTITVESGSNWNAVSNQSWCNIHQLNSSTILIAISANDDTSSRNAVITVSNDDGNSETITIIQAGHSGVRPDEDGVKSFATLIDEFNNKGIYSPSIQNSGNTSDIYNYLEDMYNKSRLEYEGNSELFLSSTYEDLEVFNYHGNTNDYELDGTAENAMLYWIIAMCISELVPTSGSNNRQTLLFKFAYDLGGNDGDGRKYRLYNSYTPKGDLTICRLVASVIYAKNRPTYKSSIPSFRSKLNGSTISVSGTLQEGLNLTGNVGSSPTNYGYSVDLDLIFPAAAGPYSPSYTNRLNSPLTLQGENHDNFNSTTLNYVIDETINETVVNNYNLKTSNQNILKRSVQAIADDYEEVTHYLDDKIYYTYPDNPGNDVTYPHDRFIAATSSSNKGYFTGTFNNSVVTSKNLSLYKNTQNFVNFLEQMRDACAYNRNTTFWPQYGRKRPSQGTSDCGCITNIGLHNDKNWLDDWGILNLVGGATKYDSEGNKYYIDRNFQGNTDNIRDENESSYYTHNCEYICSTTYPSGHSGGVWGAALALIELLSDMGITNNSEINRIYKAAYAFTVSRTIVRAHWNSDIIYGKLNTTTIFPVLHAMSAFNSIFDSAKQALNGLPEEEQSVRITINNNTGAPAKITGEVYFITTQGTIYSYIENINGVPVNPNHYNSGYNVYTIPTGSSITSKLFIENPYNISIGTSLLFDDLVEPNSPIRVYGIDSSNNRNNSAFICSDPTLTTYGYYTYVINLTLNNTTTKRNIDIAYSKNWSSPSLTGITGTEFKLPTIYIRDLDTGNIYNLNKYPYWNELKQYLVYEFRQEGDTTYANINSSTGLITLGNTITNGYGNDGKGICPQVRIIENNKFVSQDAHFYINILEPVNNPFNIIINNQTGADAYVTGEIYFWVNGTDYQNWLIMAANDENVAQGTNGKILFGNDVLIKLPQGETLWNLVYWEYLGGIKPSGTLTFALITNDDGTTEYGVRVYGHGKGNEHEKYSFVSTFENSGVGLVFNEGITTYKIKITQGKNYSNMYTPTNTITLSQSSVSIPNSGGTSIVTITSSADWNATSSDNWCTTSKSGNTLSITASSSSEISSRRTTITVTNGSDTKTINVIQAGTSNDDPLYTVGLISDIHFHTLADNGTRSITTDGNGNSTTNGDMTSLYDKDLTYLILHDFNDVDFVSSPGDIATYNINDFIYFTNTYRKAYTGSDTGTNFKPFYCSTGNHDHGLIYCYNNGRVQSGGVDIGTYGNRWNTLNFGGTNYSCPGLLATGTKTNFGSKDSYFINKNGDIYVYLMTDYGPENKDKWTSLVQPHNLLSSSNEHVLYMMNKCGKSNIFDASSSERYFNFLYYNPYDLHYLGELILNNLTKRIFVFSHHFFTNKAGTNGNYHPGGSTNLMGLTFHYLNWLNDNYTNVVWFTGHSHISWTDTNNVLHWTNKKYNGNIPTTSDYSNRISDNGTWDIKNGDTSRHYYSGMWNIKTYQEDLNGSTLGNEVYYRTTSLGTGGWNIHLPSMSRPVTSGTSQQSACEAAIMRVYSNKVEIEKLGYTTSNSGQSYSAYSSISDNLLTIDNFILDTSSIVIPSIGNSSITPVDIPVSIDNSTNDIRLRIINGMSEDAYFNGKLSIYVYNDPTKAANGGDDNGIDLKLTNADGGGNSAWVNKDTPEQTIINAGGGNTYLMKYVDGVYSGGSTSNRDGNYVINHFKLEPGLYIEKVIPSNYNGYYFCTKGSETFEYSVQQGTRNSGNPAIKLACTHYNRFDENNVHRKITDNEILQYKNKTKTTGEYYSWDNKYWPVGSAGSIILVNPIKTGTNTPVLLLSGKTYYAVISEYNDYMINTSMLRISHNEIKSDYLVNQGYVVNNL